MPAVIIVAIQRDTEGYRKDQDDSKHHDNDGERKPVPPLLHLVPYGVTILYTIAEREIRLK